MVPLQEIQMWIMLTSISEKIGETNLAISQGLTLEAENYADKPITPKDLLKKIEKLIKKD